MKKARFQDRKTPVSPFPWSWKRDQLWCLFSVETTQMPAYCWYLSSSSYVLQDAEPVFFLILFRKIAFGHITIWKCRRMLVTTYLNSNIISSASKSCPMNLCNRCRTNRTGIESVKDEIKSLSQFFFQSELHNWKRRCGGIVTQCNEFFNPSRRS